jgi:hypothetical protein
MKKEMNFLLCPKLALESKPQSGAEQPIPERKHE